MFDEKTLRRLCELGPEIVLYFTINELGGFIWRMNHDMADGRIALEHHSAIDADIIKAQSEIQLAVDYTTRFGVTTPRNPEGGPTQEYWNWFRKWDSYTKLLSNEQFKELDQALTAFWAAFDEVEKWRSETVEEKV